MKITATARNNNVICVLLLLLLLIYLIFYASFPIIAVHLTTWIWSWLLLSIFYLFFSHCCCCFSFHSNEIASEAFIFLSHSVALSVAIFLLLYDTSIWRIVHCDLEFFFLVLPHINFIGKVVRSLVYGCILKLYFTLESKRKRHWNEIYAVCVDKFRMQFDLKVTYTPYRICALLKTCIKKRPNWSSFNDHRRFIHAIFVWWIFDENRSCMKYECRCQHNRNGFFVEIESSLSNVLRTWFGKFATILST